MEAVHGQKGCWGGSRGLRGLGACVEALGDDLRKGGFAGAWDSRDANDCHVSASGQYIAPIGKVIV